MATSEHSYVDHNQVQVKYKMGQIDRQTDTRPLLYTLLVWYGRG